MDTKSISRIQTIIAIVAIVYFIAPDPVIGHFDDILVAAIAATIDTILGVSKHRISIEETDDRDFDF